MGCDCELSRLVCGGRGGVFHLRALAAWRHDWEEKWQNEREQSGPHGVARRLVICVPAGGMGCTPLMRVTGTARGGSLSLGRVVVTYQSPRRQRDGRCKDTGQGHRDTGHTHKTTGTLSPLLPSPVLLLGPSLWDPGPLAFVTLCAASIVICRSQSPSSDGVTSVPVPGVWGPVLCFVTRVTWMRSPWPPLGPGVGSGTASRSHRVTEMRRSFCCRVWGRFRSQPGRGGVQ